MSNPFQIAGADKTRPTRYAPIWNNRFWTGLWTNRNPLRDAATEYLYEKFYSGTRYESLIGGLNVEVTARLTLARRPGHSVYNSHSGMQQYNRLYEFRGLLASGAQEIRIIGDGPAGVDDVTAPSLGGSFLERIYTKAAGAGKSQFQSVGNVVYWGDGVSQKKWSLLTGWQASTVFAAGAVVTDSNGNTQLCIGKANAIATVENTNSGSSFPEVTFTASAVLLDTDTIHLIGLTSATWLNGATVTPLNLSIGASSMSWAVFPIRYPAYGPASDTGYAYTATSNGTSGSSAPAWNASVGGYTLDGGVLWQNQGIAVQNWGAALGGPTSAPTVANAKGGAVAPAWAANTFYSPTLALLDSNSNIQILTTAGTTGAAQPTWNVAGGGTTADGSAVWTNQGASAWAATTAEALGKVIAAFWTQTITIQVPIVLQGRIVGYRNQTSTVNYFDFFLCVMAGTTGSAQPSWPSGLGSQVSDGTAVWQNAGAVVTWNGATLHSVVTIGVGATTVVTLTQQILDTNNNLQSVYVAGKSGGSAPTWNKAQGALTLDGTAEWQNAGAAPTTQNAGFWVYGFAFRNALADFDSPMSPASPQIVLSPPAGFNGYISLTGQCSADPQFNTIRIFRTSQQTGSGGTPVFEQLADIPLAPSQIGSASATWSYQDAVPDANLNFLILGDTTGQNSAPPAGFVPDCYHLQRIWGHIGNIVYYTNGPDALNGIGPNETMAPTNNFEMPEPVIRSLATPLGLFVLTTAGMYQIPGSGTSSDPLQTPVPFLPGKVCGILDYDDVAVNGSTIFLYGTKQLLMIDPSSGLTDLGFPIADQLGFGIGYGEGGYGGGSYGGNQGFGPGNGFVCWHVENSTDAGLFVANGVDRWFRCNPTPAPESGNFTWSPIAVPSLAGGVTMIAACEVLPGVHKLLVQGGSGSLYYRDVGNPQDGSTSFVANVQLGSLVLAHPGQVALIDFIETDCLLTGSHPTVSVLMDEIFGAFSPLSSAVPDPTYKPAAVTLYSDRWYMSTGQEPAICRTMQIEFAWPAEAAPNELFAYTIYGAVVSEL